MVGPQEGDALKKDVTMAQPAHLRETVAKFALALALHLFQLAPTVTGLGPASKVCFRVI